MLGEKSLFLDLCLYMIKKIQLILYNGDLHIIKLFR